MEFVYSVKVDVAVPTGAVAEVTYWNPPQTIERRDGVYTPRISMRYCRECTLENSLDVVPGPRSGLF